MKEEETILGKIRRFKNVWKYRHKEPFYTKNNLKFFWCWFKNIFFNRK